MISADRVRFGRALAVQKDSPVGPDIDLRRINSWEDARAIQAAADAAFGEPIVGYNLTGTSVRTSRLIACHETPVIGHLVAGGVLRSGDRRRVTPQMLGIGAQISFVLGRSLTEGLRASLSVDHVRDAVVSCHIALQIVGRRTHHRIPLNEWTAHADFGLSDSYVGGREIGHWEQVLINGPEVALCVDGHVNASGRVSDVFGNPLEAVAWLARKLAEHDRWIDAGAIVATGSCTGLVQMSAGHYITGDFGALGSVDLGLV